MFGIGFLEILVILVVALLVFGPDRLPQMTKQVASFVRDLRAMVANARRDISVSASDLGIDEEDLKTLRELRNPKSFVRDKVLNGMDLDDVGLGDEDKPARKRLANGGRSGRAGDRAGAAAAAPAADTSATAASAADTSATAASSDLLYDPDAT